MRLLVVFSLIPYTMKYSAIHQLWLDPSFVMFMWHPLKKINQEVFVSLPKIKSF